MITKILFLALGTAALTGCSTAYKMGQTPDDVYFSPGKVQEEYVATERQSERYAPANRYGNSNRYDNYEDFDSYRNDRFLRMSIGSNLRLSAFDDYYWYDGFSNWKYNNYAYNWNTPWNSYYYWNNFYNPYSRYNFYNPYYGGVIVGNPGNIKNPVNSITRPRLFTPGAYTNNNYNNNNRYLYTNPGVTRPNSASSSGVQYNNRNNNNYYNNTNRSGGTMRRISSSPGSNTYYNNSNNNRRSYNNNTYTPPRNSVEAPVRSYTPSSSGSSSSGSSGGSGTGVSRPGRN